MRFHVGEIAVIAASRFDGTNKSASYPRKGDEVEIMRYGPFPVGAETTGPKAPGISGGSQCATDYEYRDKAGFHWFILEKNLRKRRPPIPDSVLSVFTTHKTGEPVDV